LVHNEAAQRLALAAGRTGKTPSQTITIASKPALYHQGEALSAARFVGTLLTLRLTSQLEDTLLDFGRNPHT
jgi:hypothetical protein